MVGGVALVAGVCVLAIWWFRRDVSEPAVDATADVEEAADTAVVVREAFAAAEVPFIALSDAAVGGTVRRGYADGMYAITVVAHLPAIDSATQAYEAWFVTPGITDFFSLGELYPREDGAWGLVWEQREDLARSDIAAFNRIMLIREPRDGNPAPSADHVAQATF